MFILPAHAHPFDFAPAYDLLPAAPAHPWLAPLRLPLTVLATVVLLALIRAVVSAHRRPSLPSPKQASASQQQPAQQQKDQRAKKTWLPIVLGWETLPPLAEKLPITLTPPPPPAMRGRHVYRGGRGVGFAPRRPEPALAARPQVECPRAWFSLSPLFPPSSTALPPSHSPLSALIAPPLFVILSPRLHAVILPMPSCRFLPPSLHCPYRPLPSRSTPIATRH
ncbi:hypothetical protein B0H10DRAFT_2009382 [Mycena sp. CBHHK59/15]|nr:hypothetical protein B0H10DRAFT_2009382 [Mycena sp. CBHHK59/15]